MSALSAVEAVVPTCLADLLVRACEATGLRWGVLGRSEYFFQSPKLHLFLLAAALLVCALMYDRSRGYRRAAIARLSARGIGRSLRCPINTLVAYVLMGCFATQVYSKGVRPKPLIQLGWLLMPCHMMTLAWIYVLRRQRPDQYGGSCYIATLLMDWLWSPVGALAAPDWGDHQFAFEGHVFIAHHALLVALPFYFATRYHTDPMSRKHALHLTWVPALLNFAVKTPVAMLLGLNVDYMLSPPPVKGAPAIFLSPWYRVAYVGVFVVLSVAFNLTVRVTGKCSAAVLTKAQKVKVS